MSVSHLHVRRLRVPERCRRSPASSRDRAFGLHLCEVREIPCHYRGPVFVLAPEGRLYECRKAEEGVR